MGTLLVGAARTGLSLVVGQSYPDTHELAVLAGVTGVATGVAAMLCPSGWAGGGVTGREFVDAGVVVILVVLFERSTDPRRVLLHTAQHVAGQLHNYDPCAVLGGQGVVCGSVGGVTTSLVATTLWLPQFPRDSLWFQAGYTFVATIVAQCGRFSSIERTQ
ncbi:hypothetical protein H257_06925 [Aphanomyces astaci]|uniref:Uncharacterized protein n=1 Tax=Aphanomyces astaci TaxID=112090 RepID=W4GKW8_APHAT|nr:hypothetical protein H257_06925 [Aphanomyces astaci]ETV79674.1 hypothetical protein H257_06925 [Aphanomyces astaci]|eukprot:XP_009830610.1 hypothetical protein H257_06925 [Aphanomyces astaci]